MSHQANHIDHAIQRAQQRLEDFFATPPGSKDGCRNPGGLREITVNLIHHLRGWGTATPLTPFDGGAFLLDCVDLADRCSQPQASALLDITRLLFTAREELLREAVRGMQKPEQIDRHLGEDWQDMTVALLLAFQTQELIAASA